MGLVSGDVTGGICPWPEATAWRHTETVELRGVYLIQNSCYLTYILYFHILFKINEHNRCLLIQWGAYSCRCSSSNDAHSPALCHPWAEVALRNIEQLCRNGRNSLNWMLHSQAAEQMISCSLTIQITAIKVEQWGLLRPSWRQSGKMSLQDSGLWGGSDQAGS